MAGVGYQVSTGMENKKQGEMLCHCKGNRKTGRRDLLGQKGDYVFSEVPYRDSSHLQFFYFNTNDGRFSSSAVTVAASIRISSINADSRDRSLLTAGSR
jgi:hypothetical protein